MQLPRGCARPVCVFAIPVLSLVAAGSAAAQCTEGCTAIHTFTGEAAGDQFGWVSNNVGDIDEDGVDDLILTSPTNDFGGFNAGRAYVYSGGDGDELFKVTGQANWRLGSDAAGAGDFDNDGTLDVIVGAPFVGAGRAIVYSGVDGSIIHTFTGDTSGDQFGYRVNGGGDFNGDGIDDVIIGARFNDAGGLNSGRAYIYSGVTNALIAAIDGLGANHNLGAGVSFVGDITQPADGRDDVVVGAPNAGAGAIGRAYVYAHDGVSAQFEYELDPGAIGNSFGLWFMDGFRDVNNDGTPDIYVNDFNVNLAHVFSGVDGSHIWTLNGDGRGGFGIGRLTDDVNNDGYDDMILAAWDSNLGAPNGGKAFVYSGKDASILETFTHTVANAQFGFDANGMGDVDGDGKFDYLVTAAWDTSQRGKAYIIAGTLGGNPADLDGDGSVDAADLAILLGSWGPCPPGPPGSAGPTGPGGPGGPAGEDCPGDLDGDNTVGPADLAFLLGQWG